MRNYKVVVYPIHGVKSATAWGAEFPAVKGCVGGGSTAEEAIREAFENLEIHLEFMKEQGQPMPAEDGDYSGKILLRMSKSLHQRVAMLAESEGVSLNSFINETLASKIG